MWRQDHVDTHNKIGLPEIFPCSLEISRFYIIHSDDILFDRAYEDAAQPGRTGLRPDIRMARDIARQAEKSLRHTEAGTDVSQDGTSTRSVLVRHGTQRKQVDCCSRVFLSEQKHEGSPSDGYYLSSSSPTHRLRAPVIALATQPIPFRAEIVWLDCSLL